MWEPRALRAGAGSGLEHRQRVPAMRGDAESAQPARTLRPGLAGTDSPSAKDSASHVPAEPASLPSCVLCAQRHLSSAKPRCAATATRSQSCRKGEAIASYSSSETVRKCGRWDVLTTRSAAVWKGTRLGTFHHKSPHHKEKMFRFLFIFPPCLLSSTRRWVLADPVWQPRHNTLCVNQTVTRCTSA